MNADEPRSQIVYDDPGSVTDIRKRFGQVKGESASQFRYEWQNYRQMYLL